MVGYYFIEYNNKFVHWIDPKRVAEFDFLSTAATRGNEPIGGTYHIFVDQTAIGLGQRGTNVFKVFLIRDGGNVPASQFYLPNKNFGMNLSPNNTNEGYYMRVPLEEERTAWAQPTPLSETSYRVIPRPSPISADAIRSQYSGSIIEELHTEFYQNDRTIYN